MFGCGMIRSSKTKQYLLVIGLVCFVSFGLYLVRVVTRQDGNYVVVTYNNVETARFLLTEEITYEIKTKEGVNHLEIKDGSARIISADCGNQVCVHSKAIRYTNETIVCLPHKVTIQIESEEEGAYDAITN